MYMCVQVFVWAYIFKSLGYIPRSRSAGSYDNFMFNILRKCQAVFQGNCTVNIPTSSASRFQFLHILTKTCYCLILIIAILVEVKQYLIVSFFLFLFLKQICFVAYLFFKNIYLFIYLWLRWVFVAARCGERGLLFAAVRGLIAVASLVVEHGFQAHRLQQLQHAGSVVVARRLQSTGSVVVVRGLRCSAACRIFPDQGSNPCPLHWQADS